VAHGVLASSLVEAVGHRWFRLSPRRRRPWAGAVRQIPDWVVLVDSTDWAIAENSRRTGKYHGRLDTTKIAVMGQSCGGELGRVGGHWLKWHLKGDQASKAQFVGPNCGLCAPEWDVMRKNLA
jgi:hypothetical protein